MNIVTLEYTLVLVGLFVLGSVIGSLLNVCIYRLPRQEGFWLALRSLVYPPSHCPRCQRRIPFYDNIPIFGWLFLRGRCRGCQGKISARYPLVELLTAALFVLVYWMEIPDWWTGATTTCLYHQYGPTSLTAAGGVSPLVWLHWRYALHMLLIVGLIIATCIDLDLRIIPDTVTVPAMVAGLLGNLCIGRAYIVPVWYQSPTMASGFPTDLQHYLATLAKPSAWLQWLSEGLNFVGVPAWITTAPAWHGGLVSVAGVIIGGGIIWGVRIAGRWGLRREAMGFGDVMLLAMIGSFIGWQGALVVFFLAPLCALIGVLISTLTRFEREIPYGPYLSLATLLLLLAWRWVWPEAEGRIFMLGPLLPIAGAIMFLSLIGLLYVTRTVQKLMGIDVSDPDDEELEWTSADQLAHFANQLENDRQGQWSRPRWPGEHSSRGLAARQGWTHSEPQSPPRWRGRPPA
ncbi:MAG: prepilin peptidase [Planctomycetales bacterium]